MRPEVNHRKKVYTTGEIARLCNVAPRTASKWVDCGRLKGYRIPVSRDRRVPRDCLIRFMKENGIALGPLEAGTEPVIMLAGVPDAVADRFAKADVAGWEVRRVADAFDLGVAAVGHAPDCVVLDASLGTVLCRTLAARLRVTAPACLIACLLADDDAGGGGHFDVELRGGDTAPLVAAIAALEAA